MIENAEAVIRDGKIIISLDIASLPGIVEASWAAGALDTRLKVTYPDAFARDVCRALNKEAEDGTTAIHFMFDKAFLHAFEQGAEGVKQHEDQEP
jgi:hypothetical protein